MTTAVMVADWIKRVADEERRRDAVRRLEEDTAARKAELVRVQGRRLIEQLHETVTRDVDAFRQEFSGDHVRELVLEDGRPDGGFVLRKAAFPAVSLTVEPHLETASVRCHYHYTPNSGLPPREDRFELVFAGDGVDTLQIKHLGTGQVFASSDALSEYLLVPVFTGRPR